MSDGDEYDDYDLPELTVEDLAFIDSLSSPSKPIPLHGGHQHLSIEVESLADAPVKASLPAVPHNESPYRRHRPKGILSVTDLVSPLW